MWLERNGTKVFIFSRSWPFPPYFVFKGSHNGFFFNFLNILAIFFEFCITDGIGTERNDNFYFHSFSFFSTLFWIQKKPQRYFIIFWFFFATFLEFSITLRVRTKQNDNFYFLSFSALYILFWLEMTPYWLTIIFWLFLLFLWNFLLRVG